MTFRKYKNDTAESEELFIILNVLVVIFDPDLWLLFNKLENISQSLCGNREIGVISKFIFLIHFDFD